MQVVMKHETKPIKSGCMARSEQMGLAAHGFSEEAAAANLRRLIRVFLAPLEREGIAAEQLRAMGIRFTDEAGDTRIVLE